MHNSSKASKIKKTIIYSLFFSSAFTFSYALLSHYLFGDQIYYRNLYDSLGSASISEISELQFYHTSSSEPLFGIVAWIGATLEINKDVYFSIINALLCVALLRYLLKNSATWLYIALTFLNFYIFVLLGSAERLKLAVLFTILAISTQSHPRRVLTLAAALFSHFQMLILFGSRIIGLAHKIPYRPTLKKKSFIILTFFLTILLVIAVYFWSNFSSALISKFESYSNTHGISSTYKIVALAIISTISLKNRRDALLTLTATGFASSIIGPERINMTAFFLFSYFIINEKKTENPLVISIMFYLAIKGIIFISDVFKEGTGF